MKIMQVGTGRWGTNHLRVLMNLHVDLYVAEISEAARAACVEKGVPEDHVGGDYRTFLDTVSAVDVVTPAPTHYDMCREIIGKGKDVFMEKPLAETAAQAEELAGLAADADVIFQVGHVFRFDPAADFIRDYLESGRLGRVQSIRGNFSGFKRPRSDGGVTISDGIHFIDFFNYLMGGLPLKVMARCEDLLGRGMDDMAWVWLDYGGVVGMVEANYFSPEKKRLITIMGEDETLVCDFTSSQDKIRIHRNRHVLDHDTWKAVGGEVIHQEILPAEPLLLELKHFLHCVETRDLPRAPARCGVDAMKVVEAAMASHREGRVISVQV